jgi:hypothetical protein
MLGIHKLRDDTIIIVMVNPPSGNYRVTPMSSAMVGRFIPIEVIATIEGWLAWAANTGINPIVSGFIHENRGLLDPAQTDFDAIQAQAIQLRATPNPRNWEKVSDVINGGSSLDPDTERALIAGCVGADATASFLAWRDAMDNLPDPADVYAGLAPLPDQLDRAVVTVTSVVSFIADKLRTTSNSTDKKVGFLTRLFQTQLSQRWSDEFIVLSCIMLKGVDANTLLAAIAHESAVEWAAKFTMPLARASKQM